MVTTKNFDAEVFYAAAVIGGNDYPDQPETFEVVKVFTKQGEDITSLIDELEAWEKIEKAARSEFFKPEHLRRAS